MLPAIGSSECYIPEDMTFTLMFRSSDFIVLMFAQEHIFQINIQINAKIVNNHFNAIILKS